MRKHILIIGGIFIVAAIAFWFWLRQPDEARLKLDAVIGARPQITPPRIESFPTVQVADAVGWPQGVAPTPAAGLAVKAFARGLDHPRWLYRLPNGDVLVAETNSPPREGGGIAGKVMNYLMGRAGAGVPSANRITLLRDADGDGVAETKTAFMTGLNSPFGMTLMDGQL